MGDDIIVSRTAVVLDLGSAFLKCGFAGESAPRHIIPSPLDGWIRKSRARSWGKDEWVEVLGPLLADIFIKHLKCRPKDRKVLVIEPYIPCRHVKNALHEVLYHLLRVPAILSAPSLSTSLYCTGAEGGIIVDIGYRETNVLIIAYGRLITETYHVIGTGSYHVTKRLQDVVKGGSGEGGMLTEKQAEDIVVRTCYVKSLVSDPRPVKAVRHRQLGLEIGAEVRNMVTETYFTGVEEDQGSLPVAVLEALRKCPKDLRRLVAGHIIVVGGGAMLPGFCRRLTEEIRQAAQTRPRYQDLRTAVEQGSLCVVRDIGCPRNIAPWVGGSILAILEETTGLSLFVPRAEYEEEN